MPDDSSKTPSAPTASPSPLAAERLRRARRLYLFTHDEDGEERSGEKQAELKAAERQLCVGDPIYWISNWGWLSDPHSEDPNFRVIPFLLWPEQVEMIRWLQRGSIEGRDRTLNKARSIGASWGALHLILHRFLFDRGYLAKLGSRKEDFVDDGTLDSLFGKLRFVYARQPDFLRIDPSLFVDKRMLFINQANDNEILGEATNKNFGRGGRRTDVLFDEFAHVDPDIAALCWLSLETVARSRWAISTPNGKGNRFHRNWVTAEDQDKFKISWSANPARTQEWFEGLLIENGGTLSWDEREQEHACSFSGISGYRIWKVDREAIVYPENWIKEERPQLLDTQPVVVGMDFGSGPSLTTAVIILIDMSDQQVFGGKSVPMYYIDGEVVRERTTAFDVARAVLDRLQTVPYRGRLMVVGDPSGIAKDSDQESWEANINRGGLPLRCLDPWYNSEHGIQETLTDVQRLFEQGRLKINESCYEVLSTIESWAWNIPRGATLETVSRNSIQPRKDYFSHTGDGVRYGIGFAIRGVRLRAGRAVAATEQLAKPDQLNLMPQKPSHPSRLSATLGAIQAVTGVLGRRPIATRKGRSERAG